MYVLGSVEYYSRSPESIISGLSKIGGLLAVFKIGLLLSWLHKKQFEQKFGTASPFRIRNSEVYS